MSKVAKAYYLEGRTKSDIARRTGLSRFQVARLLEAAREANIVRISLTTGLPLPELSEQVRRHLNLQHALVVDAYGDEDSLRIAVAEAAGPYLASLVSPGEVLGLGWGRTLTHLIAALDHLPPIEVLPLSGRFAGDVRGDASALAREISRLTGQPVRDIAAPFFMEDSRQLDHARRSHEVATALARHATLTTAIVAIGAIAPTFNSIAYTGVPERFTDQLLSSGAVGEILGNLFAADGSLIKSPLARHRLTISADQLQRVPRVVGVSAHPVKAAAVHAVCRAGVLSHLVVDRSLAESLLERRAVQPE